MDAIVKLAQAAAHLSYGQEKTAFVGQKLLTGAMGMAKAIPKAAGGVMSKLQTSPLTSAATATGARQFSPARTAATGAIGAMGALAGKDAVQGATGQWSGENQLGWHRQRMQGADYNAPAGGWGSPTAWARTMGSPLKSALSLGANPGPDSIAGQWQPSGGEAVMNHGTGYEELVGGKLTRKPVFSPRAQGQLQAYQQNQQQYEQMRNQHQGMIDTEQGNLDTGNYGNWWPSTVASQRTAQEAKLQQLQQQLGSGEYGGGWFGNNASHYRDQADQLAPELRRIGALGQAAGFHAAQLPGPPQAGPLDSDYSYLNYGM